MPRNLEADQEMLRQVLTLAERREIARAADIARQALAEGFEHPLLFNVAATQLEHEGRVEEALGLLERAIALAPADVGVRNALSICLQRLERPGEALHHIDLLIKAHPDLSFAHANRGNALISLAALGEARASHLRALELDPNNLASQVALAAIATHRGDHEEARGWARRVLARLPGLPDAVLSLAAAELATGSVDSAQLLLNQVLADPRTGQAERARANGLLGDVLDAAGRHDEAFGAYSTCNGILRQLYQRRFGTGTGMVTYVEAVIAALGRTNPADWAVPPAGNASAGGAAGHVFLIGFPRSGTTLLEVALDGHPRIASLEEHELLKAGVLTYMREPVDFAPLLRAGEAELDALRERYWREVREAGLDVSGKVFLDKHPLHSLKLPLIARLFPRARILFAQRDPRDVILSCFRRRFSMNPAMYQLLTIEGAAAFYDATMRLAAQARHLLGLDWQVVRYESLVEDLEQQLRAICAFIGLDWVPDLKNFAARAQARERATPSTAQLTRGLDRSGVAHWRHYRSSLEAVLPTLEPWVRRLGYEP
jgi:tetratricopeptide (TPR) repeat protein